MHVFVVHRKDQVNEVTSVVLTLVFQNSDIVFCHCFFFFVFCILDLAYVAFCKIYKYEAIRSFMIAEM